jgi:hypothetical protein
MKNKNIKEIFDIVNEKVDAARNEVISADQDKIIYKPNSVVQKSLYKKSK